MGTTTFKAAVYPGDKKKDGTYNVKIRVTHQRKVRKVSTNLFATDEDLTRNTYKIKSEFLKDQTGAIITRWRKIVSELGVLTDDMTVDDIIQHIDRREKNGNTFKLDFIKYGREVAGKKSSGTAPHYISALNCLCRYIHTDSIDISQITSTFLENFEAYIRDEPVYKYSRKTGIVKTSETKTNGRAVSSYMECIRHIHNEAKKEFNNEDIGLINIPWSPFKKYQVKKPPKSKHKAQSVEVIQAIIDLPNYERRDGPPNELTRRDLARDCFILSFALAGMNAADLYECVPQQYDSKKNILTYHRKKTRTRRADEAEMRIRIEPEITVLFEKYRDPDGERLFRFHRHYSTSVGFNNALRVGLLQVQKAIAAEPFVFYAARHSWATIGRSKEVNIDKYTIHEGLNHVDDQMRVTDIYVEKDYRNIWEANAKILSVFNWKRLQEREMKKVKDE